MAILQNTTDYATGGQVTAANLNALTESAKFVKSTGAVTSSGNTTDETTLDVSATGELIVKSLGVDTAQLAAGGVENAKLKPTSGGASVAGTAATGSHVNVIQAQSIDSADLAGDCITGTKIEDDAIGSEHLDDTVISGQTELTAAPADADEILLSDSGVIKKLGIDTLFEHPQIPKCYGNVTWDTSTPAKSGDFNVDTVTDNSSTNSRRINFTTDMANTDYVVQLTFIRTGTQGGASAVSLTTYSRAVDHFILSSSFGEESGAYVSFVVFGTLS
jgi:hypothetical protein